MDARSPFTEAMIRDLATPESFSRGREYHRHGAVLSVTLRGDQLLAEVEGSDVEPYQVRVDLRGGEIAEAVCSCPYDWGGICKHIVAALLTYLHEPDEVAEQPTVDALIAGLGASVLRTLVVRLARRRPELTDLIESEALALQAYAGVKAGAIAAPERNEATAAAPATPPIPPDPELIRRQMRSALRALRPRSRSGYYGFAAVEAAEQQFRPWLNQVTPLVEAGDGRSALVILEALLDESIRELGQLAMLSDEGLPIVDDLGTACTEALLSAELSSAERRAWAKRLADWQPYVSDYCEVGFAAARGAAEYGWDYAPLQRVLEGEITERGAWEREPPGYADELALARLNVLERQGRLQEYLYLAQAEGQTGLYVLMLVKMGRILEAVEEGLKYLVTAEEALAVAKALRTRGATEEALRIAEHGMGLQGFGQIALGHWLRDEASAVGQTGRALAAARALFRDHPSLAEYQAIAPLAGEEWPALREELLSGLHERGEFARGPEIEILLYEGRVAEAIALVDPRDHYTVVEPVVDAALGSHPEWAIDACKTQAERIMNAGKAKYYHYAADWLEKARTASVNAGREAEWQRYLRQTIDLHRRKYSLVPLLERLAH